MGTQRTSFEKLQRDRAKQAKAAAKRERRQERSEAEPTPTTSEEIERASAGELMELIEAVHKELEAGTISYEDFEEKRAELYGRLVLLPTD